jgi:predicted ATPase
VNFAANKFHPLSYQVLKEREDKEFVYAYLPVIKKVNFIPVNGVKNTHIEDEIIHRGIGMAPYFLQYLTNLKASKAFAIADGELDAAKKVDEWFERFEKLLKDIFDNPKLELKFDRKNYSFSFIEEGKEPYSFETLSDGYASVIAIVAELIMRMEAYESEVYDIQGIVLIDEIESHLHVDLQKKILPFLTTFFPKIQFIVTTHSPFVISSMKDAVVCDLEHQIVANDLSTYSYDALLESYFGVDKYSNVLKEKVIEYEALSSKKELAVEEKFELKELRAYLDQAPLFLSKELKVKLQQIDLNNLNKV